MPLALTWRYANFRHQNKLIGRIIEITTIFIAFGTLMFSIVTDDSLLALYSIASAILSVGLFAFFKKADKLRSGMPD
jgi:hypothetical protein